MKKILTSPYDIVARVLGLTLNEINENSAMGETPNWDSLTHVILIGELEKSYDIEIPNDDIDKYYTMKSIIELYKRESGNDTNLNKFKKFMKKIPVIKIFFK